MTTTKTNAADEAAARILGPLEAMLDRGDLPPWAKPWRTTSSGGMFEHYGAGGRPYHGGNLLFLEIAAQLHGFESREWMTYRAIKKAGGQVRKGEKGTAVILWKRVQVKDRERVAEDPEARRSILLLRSFTVFALEQADGIEPVGYATRGQEPEPERPAFEPIQAAARILEDYQASGRAPRVEHGGTSGAWYSPTPDLVHLPHPEEFQDPTLYYSTAYHEHGHGTGHRDRLGRREITDLGAGTTFGNEPYALEELAAETCAAVLCGVAGIEARTIENSAAYCRGWLRRIQDDRRAFVAQAGRGLQAARYILGEDDPHQADQDDHQAHEATREEEREPVAA